MPININYSPVGLLSTLAVGAGQAVGRQHQQQIDLQTVQLSQQMQQAAWARDADEKKMQLQQAHKDMLETAQRRSPVAEHVAGIAGTDKTMNQKAVKDHLDAMLSSGAMSEAQYQQAQLAEMTGNRDLMRQVLATPKAIVEKPNISNAGELETLRSPFRERRRILESQIPQNQKDIVDFVNNPKALEAANNQKGNIEKGLADLFAQEETAVNKWRVEGRGKTAPETAPETAGFVDIYPSNEAGLAEERNHFKEILNQPFVPLEPLKPITLDIAKAILKEVGGDRNAATQLAIRRGYAP